MHRTMKYTSLVFATICCLFREMIVTGFCTEECKAPGIGIPESMVQKLVDAVKAGECSLYEPQLWPKDYAEQVIRDDGVKEDFDFVVVGAGSAGSVVASRLSENSSVKVLVLEMGGDPPKESEMSLWWSLLQTDYIWNDYSIPNADCCQAMIGERCYWPHGKMIGGSGGANANVFLTGTRENYDVWKQSESLEWSWEDVNKYFSKAREQKGNATHPMGGLTLNYFKSPPEHEPVVGMIYQAAEELDLPIVENFDGERNIGVTTNIWKTTEKGRRMSTGKTYLAKVTHNRPNLKVIKNAYVKNIRFNRYNRAIAVDFTIQNKFNFSVNVSKEVILSAGALSSPKILMHSGIGPRNHLESLGIPCRKHLPVGENLQDHGVMPIFFKVNRDNFTIFDERAEYRNIFNYFLYSEGSLADTNTLIAYINSDPNSSSPYPDMQIFPLDSWIVETAFGIKQDIYQLIKSAAEPSEVFVILVSLMKPQTRGSLRLRSNNVFDAPHIDYEFGKHAADKAALVRVVRYLERMQNTKAFKAYDIKIIHTVLPKCAGLAYNSDEYWICYAKYFLIGSWHPVGTCKMGQNKDPEAVVDARLRVHGVQGVRVIDASIMPVITSGNTNGPSIMIGEKGADMVLNDWKK